MWDMIRWRIFTCARVVLQFISSPWNVSVVVLSLLPKVKCVKLVLYSWFLNCVFFSLFFLPLVHWKLMQKEPVRFSKNGESWERIIQETCCRGGWPRWYCEHQPVSHWLSPVVLIGSRTVAERPGMHSGTSCLFSPLNSSTHRPLLHPLHLSCFAPSAAAAAATPPFLSTFSREDDARHCPQVTSWLLGQWKLCLLSMKLVFFFSPPLRFLASGPFCPPPVLFSPPPFQTQTSFGSLIHWKSFPLSLLLYTNSCPDALLGPTSMPTMWALPSAF